MTRRLPDVPTPLLVAAAGVALEAVVVLGTGVAELVSVSSDRVGVGLATSAFFFVYAAGLGLCAWAATRPAGWSRAPIVLGQLIQLGLAWNLREVYPLLAGGAALLAAVVLVGVLHPASTKVLVDDPTGSSEDAER